MTHSLELTPSLSLTTDRSSLFSRVQKSMFFRRASTNSFRASSCSEVVPSWVASYRDSRSWLVPPRRTFSLNSRMMSVSGRGSLVWSPL